MSYPDKQSSLGDFFANPSYSENADTEETSEPESPTRKITGGYWCCPWCYARPRFFRVNDHGETGCRVCYAVIPVETDWYQNGEKIADVRAGSMFSDRRERLDQL